MNETVRILFLINGVRQGLKWRKNKKKNKIRSDKVKVSRAKIESCRKEGQKLVNMN